MKPEDMRQRLGIADRYDIAVLSVRNDLSCPDILVTITATRMPWPVAPPCQSRQSGATQRPSLGIELRQPLGKCAQKPHIQVLKRLVVFECRIWRTADSRAGVWQLQLREACNR